MLGNFWFKKEKPLLGLTGMGGGVGSNLFDIDSASVVTDGLIFHVDAAKSSSYGGSGTTWNDLSGQNNDMTLTSAPSHTSGSGGYFQFDGVNDTASVSLSDFNGGHNPISIEMWVNIDDTDTDYRHIFGTREIDGSDDCGFYTLLLQGANSTKMEARLSTASGNTDIIYDLGSNWNSWRQIVFTYDTSDDKTRLYINGSLVSTSSTTNTGSFGTANPFTVARRSDNHFQTQMKGSKFLIYTKALSLSEVQTNYNFYKDEFGL